MKTLVSIKRVIALATPLALIWSVSGYAQEYDDLYFTPGDREKVKYAGEQREVATGEKQEAVEYNENDYSSKTVNPEYIARYKRQASENQEVADTSDYYVEDYNGDGENVIINNYYDNYHDSYSSFYSDPYHSYPWSRYRNRHVYHYDPFYDPFWDAHYRPGWNIGWASSWGWPRYSGWHVSIGYGNFYHRPYYSRWGWDYYHPYRYGYYSHWDRPYYYSYGYSVNKNRVYYDGDGNVKLRDVTRGRYTSRSSATALTDATPSRRESAGTSGRSSSNGRVDNRYADVQSDYYRRARSRVSDDGASNARTRSVSDGRTVSPRTESQTRERARTVTPSNNERSRYYNTRSTDTRRSTTVTPSENRSRNTTVTPSRSRSSESPSRSRSYSAPSRSNDSGARRSYSTPSRSSGSSYTPSRSSSGNRGSSYTPSRSSGSSNSGTRSSSGSGSSSGSRRSR